MVHETSSSSSSKVCFSLESTMPSSTTIALAAASVSLITALVATILAAAMIFLGLRRYQSERRFCVIVSITLASIVSGVMYFDKYWSLTHKVPSTPGDLFELAFAGSTTEHPPQHLVFISPGLCETLQFLQELSFCSVVIWLAAECFHLIKSTSFASIVHGYHDSHIGVWMVPGIMYPLTFTGLWLVFKIAHRQHWLGCFERNDYDLTTSIPNSFITAVTCFFSFCLVLVFCLPHYLRKGQARFAPCLVSWIAVQPLQVLTLLQTMNYVSKKYDFYYAEPHDMTLQILQISYGLWIVDLYVFLLVWEWRQTRQRMHFVI